MSRVGIVVTARMKSARYPAKAMAPLAGRPLIEVLLDRMGAADVDALVLATSEAPENDPLAELAARLGVDVFRGDEDDVLKRHVDCARDFRLDTVVRVTGDNPLTDVVTLDRLVALHRSEDADYTYTPGDALLMGILSEVISRSALELSWERGERKHRSELVTLYIKEHKDAFRIRTLELEPALYRPALRLTVDEAPDVEVMQAIFGALQNDGERVSTGEAILWLERHPEVAQRNAHLTHRPANLRSVELDSEIAVGQPRGPA